MNESMRGKIITGKVVDIGGARNPDYYEYFSKENVASIESIDGSTHKIDFEKDKLPYQDNSVDTVVVCNVLEHIFNFNHLIVEMNRIMKKNGKFIGFVPFLIQYHPDPHDYFRYTQESLDLIFSKAGFKEIKIEAVGMGPIAINYNNVVLSMPKLARVILFPFFYFAASILMGMKPGLNRRYPMGYTFTATK
jgi:SAM-dependent methyltransferase